MAQAKAETKLETTLERLSSTYEMTFEYAQSQKAEIDIVEARKQVVILRQEISSLGNVNLWHRRNTRRSVSVLNS